MLICAFRRRKTPTDSPITKLFIMIKAIIFDCFGVIYPDILSLVEKPYLSGSDPRRQQIRELRQKADLGLLEREEFWDEAAIVLEISRKQLDAELDKVRGADWELLSYIKNLRKSGYKTGILSNVGKGFLERIFDEKHPQEDYFDEVVASAEIGIMKPDPRSFKLTTQRLMVAENECVFIDDREKHISGAREVGMKTILYKDFEQMKRELEQILAP